jgi:hypothetical protein
MSARTYLTWIVRPVGMYVRSGSACGSSKPRENVGDAGSGFMPYDGLMTRSGSHIGA